MKIRSFIAVSLSSEVISGIESVVRELGRCDAAVKWVKPSDLHVTLKFLGDMDKEMIPDVAEAIKLSAAGIGPFSLEVAGIGYFPHKKAPRIIWAGIEEGGRILSRLSNELNDRLMPLGFPKEDKGFTPHITIGRVKDQRGMTKLTGLADERYKECRFGRASVERIMLFESRLRPEGPLYTPLREIPLIG